MNLKHPDLILLMAFGWFLLCLLSQVTGETGNNQLRGFYGGAPANKYKQPVVVDCDITLSCSALTEGRQFSPGFISLAWNMMPVNGSSYHYIGGLNATLHAQVIDSHNYSIDWRGLLTIRNAIANGTKYRCAVEEKRNLGYGPKVSFVELLVLPKKPVLVITSLTTKTSYVIHTTDEPSKHFTASPTPRSHLTRATYFTRKNSTGPTQSTDHKSSKISSDVSKAFGKGVLVGVPVGVAVGVALTYAFYRYTQYRSERVRRPRGGTCSDTDVGNDTSSL